jgi:hypothetical protein
MILDLVLGKASTPRVRRPLEDDVTCIGPLRSLRYRPFQLRVPVAVDLPVKSLNSKDGREVDSNISFL